MTELLNQKLEVGLHSRSPYLWPISKRLSSQANLHKVELHRLPPKPDLETAELFGLSPNGQALWSIFNWPNYITKYSKSGSTAELHSQLPNVEINLCESNQSTQ